MAGFYDTIRSWILERAGRCPGGMVKAAAELALLLPDILALTGRVILDKRVPRALRIKIAMLAAYLSSPLDILPEGLLGPLGLLDDIVVAAFAVNRLLEEVEPEILAEHWPGRPESLDSLRELSALVSGVFSTRLGAGLAHWFGGGKVAKTVTTQDAARPELSLVSEEKESEEDQVARCRAAGL